MNRLSTVEAKEGSVTAIATTGEQLPPEWAERAGVAPDEAVQVIIGPCREMAVRMLIAQMEDMSRESQEKGLTEEGLAELVKDD